MQRRKKAFTFASKTDYTKLFIRIYEALSPGPGLTSREIDLLAVFLSFDGYLAKVARFSTSFRKLAMKELKMGPQQLTNMITDLKKKEVILEDQAGELYIDPVYVPSKDGVEIILTLHGPDEATA